MNTNGSTSSAAVVAADGTALPYTPEQIVEQLRILRQHIPNFTPLAPGGASSLGRVAHIADAFVQSATNTVGASPFVSAAVGKDAEAMRNERVDVSRWSAVEDELRTMFKGVASANLVRRHRLGLSALQTYFVARQLVRQEEHANLLPHVEEMRRVNKFGRKRRAPSAEPSPVHAPAPPKL